MGRALTSRAKRAFDVLAALAGLVLTSPLLLAGAAAVRLTSGRPILYRARRAGRYGRPFDMLKLRTMRTDGPASGRPVTEPDDDRITPAGRVLRRWKIDELPQLWHVLRGEMSIVGPRPESWEIVERHYRDEHRRVLSVRPGLVSPADIRWWPSLTYHDPPAPGTSLQEHYVRRHLPAILAEDLYYVDHPALLADLRIVWRTLVCILLRSRATPARQVFGARGLGRVPGIGGDDMVGPPRLQPVDQPPPVT
jgi:lipopolysaccharide/colanic/teichoic acid biosynthesis glycosyltransferase